MNNGLWRVLIGCLIVSLITSLAASLVSCTQFSSTLHRGDKQYLQAKSIEPLRIPPGINSEAFHNDYPVSDKHYSNQSKEISIVPPGL